MSKYSLTRPYAVLLLISLSHFLVDLMIGIWPVYKTMAEIDLAAAGLIYAVSATFGEGMQAVFGNLSDRGWRKVLILSGMALTTAGGLFAFTDHYFLLFLIFFSICLGSGAFHPAAVGLISQLTEKRKSLYITHFAAFGSLGMATSQIIYVIFYGYFNGNTLILMVPTLAVILFSLQNRLVKVIKAPGAIAPTVEKPHYRLFLEFFKVPGLRYLYISQLCNQAIAWAMIFLLPDVLKSRGFDDWIVYGGGHLIYILGGVFLLIPSGLLADRFSSKTVIFYSTLMGGVLFYTFLSLPELSNFQALGLLFAMGATISVVNPVSVALGNKLVPRNPGMISAYLMGCVWCVSEFIGPGGGGLLTKLFSEDAPARALMVMGFMFASGLWAAYRLPSEVAEETLAEVESTSS